MPTRGDDEDVTWRSLGVDGGVVSAAAAGVDTTTNRTRTSAMMTAASIAVFGLPRWRPIARTTVLLPARLREPADRAGYNARVACGEPDDELDPRPDPRQRHPLRRHGRVTRNLDPIGERSLSGATDRVLVRDAAVPPFHAELLCPQAPKPSACRPRTEAGW